MGKCGDNLIAVTYLPYWNNVADFVDFNKRIYMLLITNITLLSSEYLTIYLNN